MKSIVDSLSSAAFFFNDDKRLELMLQPSPASSSIPVQTGSSSLRIDKHIHTYTHIYLFSLHQMGRASQAAAPPLQRQPLPMAVPAGGFDLPPQPLHLLGPGSQRNPPFAVEIPRSNLSHSIRMRDAAFSRRFFRLRAQNLTGLLCGAIMLFVSRQGSSAPIIYVSLFARMSWSF
jgi:hypothetical protein